MISFLRWGNDLFCFFWRGARMFWGKGGIFFFIGERAKRVKKKKEKEKKEETIGKKWGRRKKKVSREE